MIAIIAAVGSVTAIGLICAVMLAVASKIMAVAEDERVALIRECLPGVNCGACGFSGCAGYAAALTEGGAEMNLCIVGGNEVLSRIGSILGKEPGDGVSRRVAVVHCAGDIETKKQKMKYSGIHTCTAAKQLFGGQGACTYGCIGYGDCENVCPSEAICIEKGLARIDTRKCSGCGLCARTCPNNVISTEFETIVVTVKCRSSETGAITKDKCAKGCIGCKMCVKACESEAITVSGFFPKIDYAKCTSCGKCAEICTRGCIAQRGFTAEVRTQ